MSNNYRTEQDSMGAKDIPANVYYGIQTLRATENFPISGLKPLATYIDACVLIKKATAIANGELDCIDQDISQAIVQAADEILDGKLRDQFVVDVYQAGAGTSHHMNVNEVLANRALEILGDEKGNYKRVSPNDHVNYGQSTNDVIPTAIRVGSLLALERFKAWSTILSDHHQRITNAAADLHSLGLGGSATGTGLNTHPKYRQRVAELLGESIDQPLKPAPHLMAAMQSMSPFVNVSGSLRNLAQDLVKISHDLRLMDSGPQTGFKEIQLPAV